MQLKSKKGLRLPTGRPAGISQPSGPARIKRDEAVIWDSVLKRARAGEPEAVELCIKHGLISPNSPAAKAAAKLP